MHYVVFTTKYNPEIQLMQPVLELLIHDRQDLSHTMQTNMFKS